MDDQQPSLTALAQELAELRVAFAQQQATINALRAELRERQPIPASLAASLAAQPTAGGNDNADETPSPFQAEEAQSAGKGTSRRDLLRGAAAATAAAVATVAVGATEQAHAAPQTTGGNFILGQANNADVVTSLSNTGSSVPYSVLQVITTNPNGYALEASSTALGGTALHGLSSTGPGMVGESLGASFGLIGKSNGGIDIAANGSGRIYQQFQPFTGIPNGSTLYRPGEFIRDNMGELWLCINGDGTAATDWIKVAHLSPGFTSGGAISYLSKPMRLLDTRAGATDAAVTPGKPCTSSSATTVQLSHASYNGVTLPYAMMGVMGNVTVVNAAGAGYIELVPTGAGFTGAANLAYGSGQIISNFFNVGLSIVHASPGMMGGVSFDIIIGGASTDVIIDVFAIVS